MQNRLIVALAQLEGSSEPQRNLLKARQAARHAEEAGADLLVLPEMCMGVASANRSLYDITRDDAGRFVAGLAEVASETGLCITAGCWDLVPGCGKVYGTAITFSPDGTEIASYRKLHLFDALGVTESDSMVHGEHVSPVVTINDIRVGFAMCYDLRFPELFRDLALRGAELIVVPAAWYQGPAKEDQWVTMLRARAMENTCYVAGCDLVGATFCGRSIVCDPFGITLCEAGERETLVTAEVRSDRVRSVRARVPTLRHRRPGIYDAGHGNTGRANEDAVPGTLIHHVPAATRNYVGCPSIVALPSGRYVASHSYFGNGATNTDSFVYASEDRGRTWERLADLEGQMWSKLFAHGDSVYIMGTDHCDRYGGRLNGKMVIRRSDDEGETWTDVTGPHHGLLSDEDGYHTAPTPVVVHDGRIWKGYEYAPAPDRNSWRTFVISAPLGADLIDRDSWTFSEQIESWSGYQWIEGNMVVSPDGGVVDILRANDRTQKREGYGEQEEVAAVVHVASDGRRLRHEPAQDKVEFPGGGAKFTIKWDDQTGMYYALVNPQNSPGLYRNVLALSTSQDLRSWRVVHEVIRHPDPTYHAFQYVDWDFDGEDIVYVSRTAFDDGLGGAHRAHDANYLTFGRVERFRGLA